MWDSARVKFTTVTGTVGAFTRGDLVPFLSFVAAARFVGFFDRFFIAAPTSL
jgi:hypothetical protein